jgi:hypothetical protein
LVELLLEEDSTSKRYNEPNTEKFGYQAEAFFPVTG